MAIKPKDLKFEEAALRKRIEFVRSLKQALAREDTLAAQTVHAYTQIIDDIIKEVAQEVHRAVKTCVDDLQDVKFQLDAVESGDEEERVDHPVPLPSPIALGVQMSGSKGAVDMFGNQVPPVALDQVCCPNCNRTVASGRFAPHLDKCMGRGRQASRAAAQKFSEADFA